MGRRGDGVTGRRGDGVTSLFLRFAPSPHLPVPASPVAREVRRPLGETDRNHRVVCIDELRFDAKGLILPVTITASGVAPDPLR